MYADTHHILTYDSTREIISAVKMRHKYLEGYNTLVIYLLNQNLGNSPQLSVAIVPNLL